VVRSDKVPGHGDSVQSGTVVPDEAGPDAEENPLSTVRNVRTYQVNDESAAGGKIDVQREQLAKGYEYGRTAVHISESDENITKLETNQALEVIGFILNDRVCPLFVNSC
jgi:ATP-dependent DNA helicase 2 subunit 2